MEVVLRQHVNDGIDDSTAIKPLRRARQEVDGGLAPVTWRRVLIPVN